MIHSRFVRKNGTSRVWGRSGATVDVLGRTVQSTQFGFPEVQFFGGPTTLCGLQTASLIQRRTWLSLTSDFHLIEN